MAGYVMRQFTCPKAVTHPSANRARCRATALIETNALPLHQCVRVCLCVVYNVELVPNFVQSDAVCTLCVRVCVVYNAELVPHFEQSDAAYIGYPGITDAYEKFDLELSFKPETTDGQMQTNAVSPVAL